MVSLELFLVYTVGDECKLNSVALRTEALTATVRREEKGFQFPRFRRETELEVETSKGFLAPLRLPVIMPRP